MDLERLRLNYPKTAPEDFLRITKEKIADINNGEFPEVSFRRKSVNSLQLTTKKSMKHSLNEFPEKNVNVFK